MNKPDRPGISMNFDNTVSIRQVVGADESFQEAAEAALTLVREAQERYPDWPRAFFLDIEGHSGPRSGFDDDFLEFQQEFWFSTIAHFVTAFDLPLTGGLLNPNPQRNDVPDRLRIGPET